MLADDQARAHHHLWHFTRNRLAWESLTDKERQQLEAQQWKAPRYQDASGAGLDFLGMHRHMIGMVNSSLAKASDPNWVSVKGWDPIPWAENDKDWPVPEWQDNAPQWATTQEWASFSQNARNMRSSEKVQEMQQTAKILDDPSRLRQRTLDQLGSDIEWSIHSWMHIRWSGKPARDREDSPDPSNDWLFFPVSSHVNKIFWKLHGWIDERINKWEVAVDRKADLSTAWSGPPMPMLMEHHMRDIRLLNLMPSIKKFRLPMKVDNSVVERLLR